MKIVKISGGLGNQLFQYAFAEHLSCFCEDEVKLDLSFYQNDFEGSTPRNLFYGEYGLGLPLADEMELEKAYDTSMSIAARCRRKIRRALGLSIGYPRCSDSDIKTASDIPNDNLNVLYMGYWQNEALFADVKDKIISNWRQRFIQLDNRDQKLLEDFDKNTVSVHVRGGDYLNSANYKYLGGVCDTAYYEAAFREIEKNIHNPLYIIFSDDFDFACKVLNLNDRRNVMLNWHNEDDTLKDFYLMQACHNHIMANSSFGWWAVYLNEHEESITCCPSHWHYDRDDTVLLRKNWIRI